MQSTTSKGKQKRQNQVVYLITYAICFISLGLCMAQLGVLLPYMADNIGVSIAQISFIFTTGSFGYMVGSAGGGHLYDRFNGHHLMILALVIMALMGILIPLIPWFSVLLIVIFIFGVGQGMLDIGGNVNILWVFHSDASPYMNTLHFSFGVGAFLSPILIHRIMNLTKGSLTWPFWILSILFLPGIFGLFLLKSPENHKEQETSLPQKPKMSLRLVILMVVLFFLYVGIEGGFSSWIFTYGTELRIVSDSEASYMTSAFWGALTLGRLLSIPIAKRIKSSTLLIGNFILAIGFMGIVLLWPRTSTALWIGAAGLGIALSSIFPTLMALAETRMKMSGGITGLFFLGSSLGGMVLPTMLGQIFEYIGSYQMMVTLFSAVCVGFLILIFVLLASKRVGEKIRV